MWNVVVMSAAPELSWSERVNAWLPICADARDVEEQAACLRYFAKQIGLGPSITGAVMGGEWNADRFECFLQLGALESAAAELLSRAGFCYMLSCNSTGRVAATIVVPGMDEEVHFECRSPALALVGCMAKTLSLLAAETSMLSERVRHH